MTVRVLCPGCGQAYNIESQRLGSEGAPFTCRRCRARFRVNETGEVRQEDGTQPGPPAPVPVSAPGSESVSCPACGHRCAVPSESSHEPAHEQGKTGLPTVLVAEDTAYFRELVRDTLGERYRTLLVSSKADALDTLRREKIDLFLLDLSLDDDVDGREVLREMDGKPCPILIFTARDEEDMYGPVWDELRALGADDMLIKGMNVEEDLLLKVQQLLPEPT
jgi:CheY-like chemotaxis protein